MPIEYYLLVVICIFAYSVIMPFNANTSNLFRLRFHFDVETTGRIISIPYACVIVLAPLFGLFAEKMSYLIYFVIGAAIALLMA